jgi:hypothetical protein
VQEGKRHPRDWRSRGRVRVELKNPEGKPLHSSLHTKEQLLTAIVKIIPGLEGRRVRLAQIEAYRQQMMAAHAARTAVGPGKAVKKKDKKEKDKGGAKKGAKPTV